MDIEDKVFWVGISLVALFCLYICYDHHVEWKEFKRECKSRGGVPYQPYRSDPMCLKSEGLIKLH